MIEEVARDIGYLIGKITQLTEDNQVNEIFLDKLDENDKVDKKTKEFFKKITMNSIDLKRRIIERYILILQEISGYSIIEVKELLANYNVKYRIRE